MRNIRTLPQLLFRVFVRPEFPFLQWCGRVTGIAAKAKTLEGAHGRQPFLIGYLQQGLRSEEVEASLKAAGFFRHRVAYADPGQVLSMRRLADQYPDHQYHVRIFVDGEIRGHYELTPEDHPLGHMNETVLEPRAEEFRAFCSGILRRE